MEGGGWVHGDAEAPPLPPPSPQSPIRSINQRTSFPSHTLHSNHHSIAPHTEFPTHPHLVEGVGRVLAPDVDDVHAVLAAVLLLKPCGSRRRPTAGSDWPGAPGRGRQVPVSKPTPIPRLASTPCPASLAADPTPALMASALARCPPPVSDMSTSTRVGPPFLRFFTSGGGPPQPSGHSGPACARLPPPNCRRQGQGSGRGAMERRCRRAADKGGSGINAANSRMPLRRRRRPPRPGAALVQS